MLAIIIPYYKLAFFEETLQSLENQTDQRFKVYIGDDASPENPGEVLERYKGKFDFLYHRFDTNIGGISLVKQWMRCINMTGGEDWIMILGDDDYFEETVIENWYKNYGIFNGKSNLVRFASKVIDEKSGTISESFQHPEFENAMDSLFRKFMGKTRSSLSEHVFSRESYIKHGFVDFPLAWYSDDMAWLDFSDNKPIYTINESTIFVRISEESISGMNDNLVLKYKAKELFYRNLVFDKLSRFNSIQKRSLLLEYEILAKEQNRLNLKSSIYIGLQLARIGSVYTMAKFVRRVFKAKF
ncbi:glycosyltransferase family 2 protein [Flavobacterium sp.]|uniref:glycosyltransferase family 2 protein n=1 Tax=Flavobacterium sp. TaxID=239 RepID=UPI003753788F